MSREKGKKPEEEQQQLPVKRRGISAWTIIQWFLIPLLLVAALGGGLVAGYVILGKREFSDVLLWSTWKHVYDLVFAP
ncbi:DNA-directed RNA polymerase subunit beta [Paenibacillus sp. MMS20-IR301]|uniref:DNA-directed RNA polymerase subunit beta n=1 Tax=Paenibacillus sp. MMS20-IR301 TaxID=2895946 RepID=UPI0028F04C8B|nr:DNA-directed RNA polymerase subunit beta [Paenibacillus sp. MMS20-IR301]WNS42640.1 DNA-directed RNA polymerase subunit beta [Paenibacillus sp. MMS20-IR301]